MVTDNLRFDGRVVIVTGAGAGLGRAYALLFGSRGASVVVNDLGGGRHGDGSSTKIADTVVDEIRKLGGKAVANYNNVLDGDKIVQTAIDAFGRIDIVINNAGILRDKSFVRMSDTDWDLIHDVHVKGSMKTTRAAWPYFRKQNFGRVILTSSNSGLYGNFGQANYSAAKLGLVGLANTLAIEGVKNNIHTNVIVPTAASRLTEDILPPEFFEQLKPEYIAPVVAWLCHDDCKENGSIIESAIGWAGKCRIVRSNGHLLRRDMNDIVTPEAVRDNWNTVTDMTNAKAYDSIQEVTGEIMGSLEKLKSGNSSSSQEFVMQTNYTHRDAILYALGVGATRQELRDICYLYENHENFSLIPSFYVTFGPMGLMTTTLVQDALPNVQLDPTRILHGEQYLEIHKKLPVEGKVESRFRIQDVLDKGKGAVVLVQYETYDVATGDKLTTNQISAFAVGAGGFGGPRNSRHLVPCVEPPKRKPCVSVTQKTSPDQAAIYRLSGDYNPLHMDDNIATMAGFSEPILHGLCSLGFSTRHVLQTFADGDPDALKTLKVRFAKPVLPGQTLRTDMWRNGNRIHFQTTVVENNSNVITGAYMDLKEVKTPSIMSNLCSAAKNLESDAVFAQMADYVKSHPEQVKKINGVFHYIVTSKGEPQADWTLDLKKCVVYKGKPEGKVDTTLTIDDKDMIQLALGKLNPQMAFMKGKLKIKGNIMLTQKLKSLIDANKPKL
ncbi:peroxisomal multifunctional enzyme type 2 isoform X1 [Nasonia vitripennis]|uniref:Peroxisomal multifunctional enzyme type 2 n=2 Tax=Nasonia vitripennis TaxID=7425 RepID=A0A7M7G8S9_NASVI|nr:peroxisomal multifunctional enzyme type 2 isoform X1 [Nasonia vitripennis]